MRESAVECGMRARERAENAGSAELEVDVSGELRPSVWTIEFIDQLGGHVGS